MDLSMKDKNYEERYQAYMQEGKKLIDETTKKRHEIYEKYKNVHVPIGLDGTPGAQEYKKLSCEFGEKIKKLQEKYGI